MLKFLFFQLLIIVPFLTAILVRVKIPDRKLLSRIILNFNLICLEPIIVGWSIWGLQLEKSFTILPIAGLLTVISGFGVGIFLANRLRLKKESRATFIISSSIVNHGFTMGGSLCYLFLGESGLGQAVLYAAYFMPFIFTVIFPFARNNSSDKKNEKRSSILFRFKKQFINWQSLPFYALIVGLSLNLCDITRPHAIFKIEIPLYSAIILYYFSLGLTFSFSKIKSIRKENALIAGWKFILLPATTIGIMYFLPVNNVTRDVILIESFMPAAVYSVVSSVIFKLDHELAAGIFVVNTLIFMTIILPLMLLYFL